MLNKFRYILNKSLSYRTMDKEDITKEEMENMAKQGAIILDVRSPQEYDEGHVDGAILIPEYELKKSVNEKLKDKNQAIVVYCASGQRSKKACMELRKKGYKNVYNLFKRN